MRSLTMDIRIGTWHISIAKTPTTVESWNKYLLKWARLNYKIINGYLNKIELIKTARDIWNHDTDIPEKLRLQVFNLRNLKEEITDVLEQELKTEGKL
jgi:hypothetical protein